MCVHLELANLQRRRRGKLKKKFALLFFFTAYVRLIASKPMSIRKRRSYYGVRENVLKIVGRPKTHSRLRPIKHNEPFQFLDPALVWMRIAKAICKLSAWQRTSVTSKILLHSPRDDLGLRGGGEAIELDRLC